MRKFLIVAVAAMTAAVSFDTSAYAATVTMRHGYHHRPHGHHCAVRTVRHRDRHGHVVIRKTRVCR